MINPETREQIPASILDYVNKKLVHNGEGGRPHFLTVLKSQNKDSTEELLSILEEIYVKNKTIGSMARKYSTTYKTIYRILRELEPFKAEICEFLNKSPRRKRWYIEEQYASDYETIQSYIRRAKRDGLKTYRKNIRCAGSCWAFLNYKDPELWTPEEVNDYLATLKPAMSSHVLDCIRLIAPKVGDKNFGLKTGRFREKIKRRKKDIFGKENQLIRVAIGKRDQELLTKYDLHITIGAREGQQDPESGIVGISWDRFKEGFTKVDDFESKVRGGIFWRDCPVDQFYRDLPERLRALWTERGRPSNAKVFLNGYKEVLETYSRIRKILQEEYEGKIDPSLLKEFTSLRPHDADKIHVNLLWEAEVPLEVVAGQDLKQGEGVGLCGRGWLDTNVIKKYYLSLTARSVRFQKIKTQIQEYSQQFNEIKPSKEIL